MNYLIPPQPIDNNDPSSVAWSDWYTKVRYAMNQSGLKWSSVTDIPVNLVGLAIPSTNGIYVRTGSGTASTRSLTQPAAGVTISNSDGVAGNPTFALANDLAALETLSGTGIAVRSATDTWVQRSIATASTARITVSNGDGVAGNPTLDLATTTVTAGSYTSADITVDAYGRVTAAANGSGGGSFLPLAGGTMTGALGIIAGSAGSPGLFISGDTNTGIYSTAGDNIGIATGGSARLAINSTGTVAISAVSGASILLLNSTTRAWGTGMTALSVGTYGQYYDYNGGTTGLTANAYYDGSNWKYISTNYAIHFDMAASLGQFLVQVAPSGTAGNTITWRSPLIIDSTGAITIAAPSTGNTITVAQLNGAAAISATSSLSGGLTTMTCINSSNTANSDARIGIGVGGTSAGDAYVLFDIPSTTDWSVGVDNSASDAFVISKAVGLGTNNVLSISTAGNWSIAAPTSGTAIRINGLAGDNSLAWTDGTRQGGLQTASGFGVLIGATTNDNLFLFANNNIGLVLTSDLRVYGTALHNNAGAVTGTTNQYVASGTYTPTTTAVTNVAAASASPFQWIRVGNVVTVSGNLDITPSAAGGTSTEVGIALPIATNMTTNSNLGGTGATTDLTNGVGVMYADVTNDRARLKFLAASTSLRGWAVHFTYLIL